LASTEIIDLLLEVHQIKLMRYRVGILEKRFFFSCINIIEISSLKGFTLGDLLNAIASCTSIFASYTRLKIDNIRNVLNRIFKGRVMQWCCQVVWIFSSKRGSACWKKASLTVSWWVRGLCFRITRKCRVDIGFLRFLYHEIGFRKIKSIMDSR